MRELTIDRKTWLRGCGSIKSKLLNNDGMRCCLGFECQALGYTDEQLLDRVSPRAIVDSVDFGHETKNIPQELAWLVHRVSFDGDRALESTPDAHELMSINDIELVENREERIAEIFARNGVEVKFIN